MPKAKAKPKPAPKPEFTPAERELILTALTRDLHHGTKEALDGTDRETLRLILKIGAQDARAWGSHMMFEDLPAGAPAVLLRALDAEDKAAQDRDRVKDLEHEVKVLRGRLGLARKAAKIPPKRPLLREPRPKKAPAEAPPAAPATPAVAAPVGAP